MNSDDSGSLWCFDPGISITDSDNVLLFVTEDTMARRKCFVKRTDSVGFVIKATKNGAQELRNNKFSGGKKRLQLHFHVEMLRIEEETRISVISFGNMEDLLNGISDSREVWFSSMKIEILLLNGNTIRLGGSYNGCIHMHTPLDKFATLSKGGTKKIDGRKIIAQYVYMEIEISGSLKIADGYSVTNEILEHGSILMMQKSKIAAATQDFHVANGVMIVLTSPEYVFHMAAAVYVLHNAAAKHVHSKCVLHITAAAKYVLHVAAAECALQFTASKYSDIVQNQIDHADSSWKLPRIVSTRTKAFLTRKFLDLVLRRILVPIAIHILHRVGNLNSDGSYYEPVASVIQKNVAAAKGNTDLEFNLLCFLPNGEMLPLFKQMVQVQHWFNALTYQALNGNLKWLQRHGSRCVLIRRFCMSGNKFTNLFRGGTKKKLSFELSFFTDCSFI